MTCETKQCPTHGDVFPINGMCPWGCNHRFDKKKRINKIKVNKINIKYEQCEVEEDVKLYSCNEAGVITNTSSKTLRRWANQGIVPHVIANGFIKFTQEHVDKIKQAIES